MTESGLTAVEISNFMDEVSMALATREGDDFPEIEAERNICEHYNRENLKGFDSSGYFIFHGVKVYEKGKKDFADNRDALTMEDVNFRGKKR
jgi:hypothetical protein